MASQTGGGGEGGPMYAFDKRGVRKREYSSTLQKLAKMQTQKKTVIRGNLTKTPHNFWIFLCDSFFKCFYTTYNLFKPEQKHLLIWMGEMWCAKTEGM